MRWLSIVAVLLGLVPASVYAQAPSCGFQLGFKAIADQIGTEVGQCLENEHFNTDNGNAEQRTTAWHGKGGLLVWRKADNWTAYTDGANTWVNGPFGIQKRANTERFPYEAPPSAAAAAPASPVQAAPAPQSVNGRGQQVKRMILPEGLAVFKLAHDGRRNFVVWLLDANGQQLELLVNQIGPYQGSTAVGIEKAGEYVFNVEGDGAWMISVEHPRPASAAQLPQTFSGKGSAVTPFFDPGGKLRTYRLRYTGQRNFVVWLLDAAGEPEELLVNVIGAHDGSVAVGRLSGPHLIRVESYGDWTITVE